MRFPASGGAIRYAGAMRGVWLVVCGGLAAACGSEVPAPASSTSAPAAPATETPPSSVAVSAREAPTFARATAGAVVSEPVVPGTDLAGPMIARLVQNCFDAEPLPADVTVTITFGGLAGAGGTVPVTVEPAGMRASVCAATALRPVTFVVPEGALLGVGRITVPLHLAAATEPETPVVWPEQPLALCATDADCTTVFAGCGWHPVHTRYTSELAARETAAHGARECRAPSTPPEAHCVDLVCTIP